MEVSKEKEVIDSGKMKPTIEEEGKEGDEPSIEEIVNVLVPLFLEQTAEVIKVILQE